jgi:FdhE protein
VTRKGWLANHSFLQPMDQLDSVVEELVTDIKIPCPAIPNWQTYTADFVAGVPVLQSASTTVDIEALSSALKALAGKLGSKTLAGDVAARSCALNDELHRDNGAAERGIAWLLGRSYFESAYAGLFWYLGWTVLAKHLSSLITAFTNWRDDEGWLRNYCPVCGMPPAMAQLLGVDPARIRLLSCGCCRTRWRFPRKECPFCETSEDQQLAVLAIEGERGMRIDYCKTCAGYIKTYDGTGNEEVMLADWTSIHLDIAAIDRGLARRARSLFELPA